MRQAKPHPVRVKWQRSSMKATSGWKPWLHGGRQAAVGRRWLDPGRPTASLLGAATPGQHAGGTLSASPRRSRSTPPPGCRPRPHHGVACTAQPNRTGKRPLPPAPRRSAEARVIVTPHDGRGPTPRPPRSPGCTRRLPRPSHPTRPPHAEAPSPPASGGGPRPAFGWTAAGGTRSARGAPHAGTLSG